MSFIPWIEDDNVNATQDYNTYLNDSQRKEGFKGGTPASAIRVNTALRQANLVATALMKALNVSETLNYRSSITDVQTAINTQLTTKIVGTKVNDAEHADNADNADNAVNSTNAVNATNSTKINDISITRTDKGILKTDTIRSDTDIPSYKVGDIIIPQYKVVYADAKSIGSASRDKASFTAITSGINAYKTYEIELSMSNFGAFVHRTLKLQFGHDDTDFVWFIISLPTQMQNTISMQMVAFYVSPASSSDQTGTLYGNFVYYWRNFKDDTSGCSDNQAYYNCQVTSIKEVIE